MQLKSILLKASMTGAAIIKDCFDKPFAISSKDTVNDLVTEVDKKSEKAIIEVIRQSFPDHYILSEEAGPLKQESPYKWIIDPIDGTVNYAHHIPICCVSIALEYMGEVIMGTVYNPFLNELFFAQKGFGASLNNKRIHVSQQKDVERACLVTGFPYQWEDMKNDPVQVFGRFIKKGAPVRRFGSAAIDLCWVACGRLDAFWEHKLNPWDSAAGYLIVEEAGGKVTDFEGKIYSPYQKKILATNGHLHEQMLKAINDQPEI